MSNSDLPIWLQGENVVFFDDDQFAVIIIGNSYFPIGKFTGHMSTSGCRLLSEAKEYSKIYYSGDNNVKTPNAA